MKQSHLLIAAIAALSIGSCKSKIKPDAPMAGDANFSTYVAIGNSLTSGFADGTLYRSGQENSYPSMLAEQFALVGGGAFKQPLLPGESGWPIAPSAGYNVKRVLGYSTDCTGATSLGPILYTGLPDTAGSSRSIASQGPFNNVGVPGIRCIDFTFTGYGLLNPYAARFYANPATQRPVDIALQSVPTFFTMWLGSNDVLGYATSGGTGAVGGIAIGDISPVAAFKASYDYTAKALNDIGAKGVLINIPDVTTIPYFTTVPSKGLVLTRQGQADSLTAAYAALGIKFTVGANYFIMADSSAPGNLRQMTAKDYICLSIPQNSLKCLGMGSIVPIPDQYVLDEKEVANVKAATDAFNQIISDAATTYGYGLMDANTYLRSLQSGITWNGVTYTPTFVTGGAFSLDGVHLTPRGYALVANQILKVINQTYHSTLPEVDVNKRNGVLFP
jgi:lysophospholipase L1-like esterase